jgi:hypothetical protein
MVTPPRMYQLILDISILNSFISVSSLTRYSSISEAGSLIRLLRKNLIDLDQQLNLVRVRN